MNLLVFIHWPVDAWSIPDAKVALLRERFPALNVIHATDRDATLRAIADADFAFTPFLTAEMVQAARRLRWVHSPAAAVEGLLPLKELAARKIVVTNSRGIQAVPMAEHVMGGLLVLARRFDRMITAQREHRWIQNDLSRGDAWPFLLQGRRMTIVGLGTIGDAIAVRAHAFGIHVTRVRRRPAIPKSDAVDRVVGPDRLDEALRNCDILVVAAPGVASTAGMIGEPQLALLSRGALLVNVARAQIVDDHAMRAALASGQLGGAVLDVFEKEPLPTDSPLWDLPNVVITPHNSGFRQSHWNDVAALFIENCERFQRGDSLLNPVDLAAGY
jgi:phosphoglycerate dehydrogenase-like enzyme